MDYSIADKVDATPEKKALWSRQRAERGFDDTELWNLKDTIMKFALPRLKVFKENLHSYPCNITPEKWEEILDEIIWYAEQRSHFDDDDFNYPDPNNKSYWNRYKTAETYFLNYFVDLWD